MLSTNDRDLADFARSFRTHGVSAKGRSLERLGNNYRLPELSAALGLRQLARLAEHTAARNRLATRYRRRAHALGVRRGAFAGIRRPITRVLQVPRALARREKTRVGGRPVARALGD